MSLPDREPSAGELPVRRAGRVILLDPDGRVLLMRYEPAAAYPHDSHWSTPGGGLDPGETYPEGALRELAEETGWTDITLGAEIVRNDFELIFDGRPTVQRERLYLARTDQPRREIRGVEAMHASDGIAAWRWWTADELDATPEVVWPEGLADIIRAAHPGAGTAGARTGDLPVRHAARIILLDPADRVLLMRYDDPDDGRHWSTPGGGLDPGETYPEGALRELAEETGWTDVTLGPEVLRREHEMHYAGRLVRQDERIYLARTDQPGRQISGVDAMHDSDGIAAWHWWSLAELDATSEVIWPATLAEVIRAALHDPST
jgi:ADP-ribose pyrophosphatase YjhB (NUDIX family)